MAQQNIVTRLGSMFIGEESSYGALPTMTRAFPLDTPVLTLEQAELEVMDIAVFQGDYIDPVKGLKTGRAQFGYGIRPHANPYDKDATPAPFWESILLKSAFGAHTQAAGSLVASGASATGCVVTNPEGSRFTIGTWIAVETGVSGGTLEPVFLTNVSGNTLTWQPNTAATPFVTGKIINSDTFTFGETFTTSYYLQGADVGDSTNHAWSLKAGRTDTLEFTTERGALLKAQQTMQFADWDGPTSADSISVAAATDPTRAHMALAGATTLLQAKSVTTTRTHYPFESLKITMTPGHVHTPELGGTGGTTNVFHVGGRPRGAIEIKCRADVARDTTDWVSRTELQAITIVPIGSGLTKRFVIFDIGTFVLVGKPNIVDDGGRRVMTLKGNAKLDERATDQTTAIRRSPIRIALI